MRVLLTAVLSACFLTTLSPAQDAPGGNSMRKVRARPSELAARAGSAVEWRPDLGTALEESRRAGLPVFWYVPTVAGSPMDRKPEIDRYMMAGPFSWPSTIALLNEHFVPVREPAGGESQETYGLTRGEFIEPGWLVLEGDGRERARLDRITTFHPLWFERPLRELAEQPPAELGHPALREAWDAYAAGDRESAFRRAMSVLDRQPGAAADAEARWLAGAVLARTQRMAAARETWEALAEAHPDHPLGWKAAAEAEGHGPFARGFEDYLALPERALTGPGEGSRAPIGTYDERELWRRGAAFLVAMDDGDGCHRDSTYDFGGTDSLPNVYAAVSALSGMALLEARDRLQDGRALRAVEDALARIGAYAADMDSLALADRDEIVWALAYRARLFAQWIGREPDRGEELLPLLQGQVDRLQRLQPDSGAWFHEYPNPFAIATALTALHHARAAGAEVDGDVVARGTAALLRCRADNGAYTYGYVRQGRTARASVPAAAGRMPLCELALIQWEASGQEPLVGALKAGFEHHLLLAAVRKYDDHADRYGYGGFFFWYDMHGRSEALLQVQNAADRQRWQAIQKKLVLDLPEFDGCFVDSHELGRVYGTAMALLCLAALS